ncbi:MAG: SAM-dependent methyltransferase [Paracoccaceae bacterium]|jgi:SAM-dependent methyltransferase
MTTRMTEGGRRPFADADFTRVDEKPDELFYTMPRLVTHIDDAACAALSAYYAETLRDGDRILDLMSSCVSHLPVALVPGRVVGHGMNETELEANPQLDEFFLQNLNKTQVLPLEDASFDACLIAVSVQYLVSPVTVFAEIGRILRPGGRVAVSFSNRMFPTKAVAIWRTAGDAAHRRLVAEYLHAAQQFDGVEVADISPRPGRTDPLFIATGRKS